MPDTARIWMDGVRSFFDRHCEREFLLTTIPVAALPTVARARLIVLATSSSTYGGARLPPLPKGGADIPCIVWRGDPSQARRGPSVFLLAGAPPPPMGRPARAEEDFCARMWAPARAADRLGVPLAKLMADPALFARAFQLRSTGQSVVPRRPPEPGFKSEAHRRTFEEAARQHERGGPLAAACGARLPGGKTCGQPPLKGEKRCLRHGGAAAARRRREAQLRGLKTGAVSPAEFARAEARRARNALLDRWKRDPRLPGTTIDLGPDEWAFREAAQRRDVDVSALYPAVSDWLRWQWQRRQKDRPDLAAWMRICREDLPRRAAAADAAAFWAALGGYSRATRHGRALALTLAQRGPEAAQALVDEWQAAGLHPPRRPSRPLSPLPVRPWTSAPAAPGSKRLRSDPQVPRTAPPPPPLPGIFSLSSTSTHEQNAALLQKYDVTIRRMFAALTSPSEERAFLAALHMLDQNPGDPAAHAAWGEVVRLMGPGAG